MIQTQLPMVRVILSEKCYANYMNSSEYHFSSLTQVLDLQRRLHCMIRDW